MVISWQEFYLQCGGTCEIGSVLPEALVKAGFKIKDVSCVGGLAPSGHRLFNWWKRLNEDFNQAFKEKGLLTDELEKELRDFWETNYKNQNAFIYTPLIIQISAEKP